MTGTALWITPRCTVKTRSASLSRTGWRSRLEHTKSPKAGKENGGGGFFRSGAVCGEKSKSTKAKSNCIKESVYIDDGCSGTNFNRLGIQRLFRDTKNEKIDCIIVKDFSRFGRDYMEVGAYLEQIFPFLGIRFISINDHYDSECYHGGVMDFDVNFKNLFYDLYSKDLSQKVKTSLWAKKESGQYVSGNAPFGYEKSSEERHTLVVCEEEARVVQLIFSYALLGMTSSQIAKKLNAQNIPAPIEFKIKKGKTSRKPKGDKFYWSGSTICGILRNPVYVGDVEYGKTEREQVGGKNVLKAKEDWKIIKNHHIPIIAREDFEKLQKNREKGSRRQKGKKSRHPLAGKVVCGCCRRKLRLKEGKNPYFTCYNRYVTGLNGCVQKIDAAFLTQKVLSCLNEYLEERNLVSEIVDRHKKDLRKKQDILWKDIRREERESAQLKKKQYESYRLYSLGERTEFCSFRAEIEKKQEIIQERKAQIVQIDERMDKVESEEFIWEEDTDLALEVIKRYVKEVVVYENSFLQ